MAALHFIPFPRHIRTGAGPGEWMQSHSVFTLAVPYGRTLESLHITGVRKSRLEQLKVETRPSGPFSVESF